MREPEEITSRQNKHILEAVSLKEKSNRKKTGLFFFEGKKLFEEAVTREVPLEKVFIREDVFEKNGSFHLLPERCRVYRVTQSVYAKLTEEKSPEGIFCIAKTIDKYHKFATIYKDRIFEDGIKPQEGSGKASLLMAVSLRDPGNLGTVIRTAAAFGFDGLLLSEDCADIYSSKTVRAAMGTLFDMPITVLADPEQTVTALKEAGYSVYGSALDPTARTLGELPEDEKCCYILGNEGHGLPDSILDRCTGKVFIPMSGKAESLNVSVAAAILMYQRAIRTKKI